MINLTTHFFQLSNISGDMLVSVNTIVDIHREAGEIQYIFTPK